jgi:tRNA nucleotidyltransferase (CCA-adding enzyme)
MNLPDDLREILGSGGPMEGAYLVGGCVRDFLLHRLVKDYDVEVFGTSIEVLEKFLVRFGKVDLVGKSFGVIKVTTRSGAIYDFSIPRRDSKVGIGHKGFRVDQDPDLTMEEAAARRDFTINAIFYDPRNNRVLDPFSGARDLQKGVLRHTSAAFSEDPLRVLRGMQFCARFKLHAAEETLEQCRSIKQTHPELAVERVREEWLKWATRSVQPSMGLKFLEAAGWLEHYPEVAEMRGVPQDPEWHPEGDVWTHTCFCCDAVVNLPQWQTLPDLERAILLFAVLCHDMGKVTTTATAVRRGVRRIVSPGHEIASVSRAESFMARLDLPEKITSRVLPLVRNHMAYMQGTSDRAIRRLSVRLAPSNVEELAVVMSADQLGRPPKPAKLEETVHLLLARAEQLAIASSPPAPILKGRDLLRFGFSPGPELGSLLKDAFQAQIDGSFGDYPGALRWLVSRTDLAIPDPIREEISRAAKAL